MTDVRFGNDVSKASFSRKADIISTPVLPELLKAVFAAADIWRGFQYSSS
ncbi:MAG: hypothetical protein L0Y79_02905 [Chlorobi bacterium]|nr:hypothetical protein [Chlorobiota bacterium]MCI0715075.1 hypothetical protein [Chlorobiota bacterium]